MIAFAIFLLHYDNLTSGILAQLGEHLPYKQGVIGSSPIGPTYLWGDSRVAKGDRL